jgi:hypothetical protein
MTRIVPCVIAALTLGLSACANPYDPVERGFGGGLWGAASGAAIGAAAGGGPGAALGAAIGGATGVVAGVASVQIHSEDSLGKSRPKLTSKFLPHRRRPVPMPHMGPGLRREDENRRIAVNEPYESEH